MSTQLGLSDIAKNTASPPAGARAPHIFNATVQGLCEDGEWFEQNVPLDGHLDGDLYLRLDRAPELDGALFIVMRLSNGLGRDVPAVRVAVHGRVESVYGAPGGNGYDLRVRAVDYQLL